MFNCPIGRIPWDRKSPEGGRVGVAALELIMRECLLRAAVASTRQQRIVAGRFLRRERGHTAYGPRQRCQGTGLNWHVITETTFARRDGYHFILRVQAEPAVRDHIVEGEAHFIDRSATLFCVGDESVSHIPGSAR